MRASNGADRAVRLAELAELALAVGESAAALAAFRQGTEEERGAAADLGI